MDSILYVAFMAVSDSAPTASIWPAFLHGAAFGAGILAAFGAFCGVLLAGDAARRRAVARARLRRALAALDAEDIVTLIQQQRNAELRRTLTQRAPGVADRHDLQVFGERVVHSRSAFGSSQTNGDLGPGEGPHVRSVIARRHRGRADFRSAPRGVHDHGHAGQADRRADDVEAVRAVAVGDDAPDQ